MPIPQGYSRNTFYGVLPGGEIFNWSLWADQAPTDATAASTAAGKFRDTFNTALGGVNFNPKNLLSSDSSYSGVRTYSYAGTTGHATAVGDAAFTGVSGTSSANRLPQQCALCVTLLTAVPGRHSTGRVYLPVTNFALTSPPGIDSTTIGQLANWFAGFITSLNSAMGAGRHIGVLSQTTGAWNTVTDVRIDSRIDIQRRRANHATVASKAVAHVS